MIKLLISVLAVLAFTACSQDEVVEQQQQPAGTIAFAGAFVDNATRAAVDPSITTDNIDAFDVWGFLKEDGGDVFNQQRVNKSSEGAWTYSPLQYWIPGNTYYFAALAPVDHLNITVAQASGEALKSGLGTVTFVNLDGTDDLIYAANVEEAPAAGTTKTVNFTFSHLLSKVKFSFTNGFANENNKIIVKDVKMVVPRQAKIDLAVPNWWDNNDWQLDDESTTTLEFGDMNEGNALLVGENSAECANERLTIPAASTQEYLVTFDVELYSNEVLAYSNTLSTTITGVALEMGKAYNFHATLDKTNLFEEALKPIQFDVTEVKEWVKGNGYNGDGNGEDRIETEVIGVSSEAELLNALGLIQVQAKAATEEATATEVNIKLLNNINLTSQPLAISNMTVGIDLNGKTLTAAQFTESNGNITTGQNDSWVFWVKENGVLNITGNGVVESKTATYSMAVWAKGGTVNIYGGHYKNASHGDLIYASAEGQVNIYGGEYTAAEKKATNNGTSDLHPCLNLKDNTNSSITVYGGMFHNFNPANCLAEGDNTNFVAEGYVSKETSTGVYEVIPATEVQEVATTEELAIALAAGGTIKLTADINLTETILATGNSVLNLNGFTIKNTVTTGKTDAIIVKGSLTINDAANKGGVQAATGGDGYSVIAEGTLVINGGTFKSGLDAAGYQNAVIYARGNGNITINGGIYQCADADKTLNASYRDYRYTINKKDVDCATTTITIKGGKFYRFDPANNLAEGAGTDFVANSYKSYAVDADWFAVVAEN